MAEPRVPGEDGGISLPCGETIHPHDIDLGMREFDCGCGGTHAVVTDAHPMERFLPEFLTETLVETIEAADDYGEFGTPHLLGLVLEEFPEGVVSHDASGDGQVGYAVVWVTDFDARRLHEVIVELVLELMDHAISHADEGAAAEFERHLFEFDVAEFVTQYRAERDLTADDVPGYERG